MSHIRITFWKVAPAMIAFSKSFTFLDRDGGDHFIEPWIHTGQAR